MSLFLCFSSLISSFKACSLSLTFNSCSFCFWFEIEIFSNLSCSCFSNFNLLVSSFLSVLYWSMVWAILSKNAFIYLSKFKLILKLNLGFKEFWIVINFNRKFWSFEILKSLFVLLIFKIFFLFFFDFRLFFLFLFLFKFDFLNFTFLIFFFIFLDFFNFLIFLNFFFFFFIFFFFLFFYNFFFIIFFFFFLFCFFFFF